MLRYSIYGFLIAFLTNVAWAQELLPRPEKAFRGKIGLTYKDSEAVKPKLKIPSNQSRVQDRCRQAPRRGRRDAVCERKANRQGPRGKEHPQSLCLQEHFDKDKVIADVQTYRATGVRWSRNCELADELGIVWDESKWRKETEKHWDNLPLDQITISEATPLIDVSKLTESNCKRTATS